jgi:tRNA U55 pseudouridine synthase TruB
VGLDVLEAAAEADGLRERLLPADAGVPDLPAVRLSEDATTRLRQGQPVPLPASEGLPAGPCRVYDAAGRFVGLGEAGADGRLAPRRLFRLRREA